MNEVLALSAASTATELVLVSLLKSVVLFFALLTIAGNLVWIERRLLGRLQHRLGPNRCGPFGVFQAMADVFKLFTKEESTPPFSDKVIFTMAPIILMATTMIAFGVIPFDDNEWAYISDLDIGVLVFLALSSLGVYAVVLAGWSSNNKYSLLGGLRATAQLISYELTVGLAVLGVVLMAGSFNFRQIVHAQNPVWFVFLQPIGFVVFVIAAVAESRRLPFDLPEAENELVAGFHTEYSSMKFAMFFLGEYVEMMLLASVIALLYLGGWHGPPWLWGWVWMLLKVVVLLFVFIWIRATLPRFRYDHLMKIGWQWLLPLAILNIVVTALVALAFPGLLPNALR